MRELIILICLLFYWIALAETQKTTLNGSFRTSANMLSEEARRTQSEVHLAGSYLFPEVGTISIQQGLSKSYQKDEELDLTNTRLGFRHTRIALHRDVGVQNGLFVRLPTNKKTREKDRLKGAIGLENIFDFRPGIGPVLISNRLSITKNFHEFSVNAYGIPTIDFAIAESVTATGELSKVFRLSFDITYLSSTTYRGTTKGRVDLTQELGATIDESLSISIGHTNGEDLIRSTERSSSLTAFDQTTSTIYGSMNWIF